MGRMASGVTSTERTLRISAALDDRFHRLMGDDLVTDKDRAFRELFRILEASHVPYALIGGVALQFWLREPRTTLDIDVAVMGGDSIPREALRSAGFSFAGRHEHSENWKGPEGVPIQFTIDPEYDEIVRSAVERPLENGRFRVARSIDLLHAKLRAAGDPSRRKSKRLQDLADAVRLVEEHAELADQISPGERALLDRQV